MKQLFTVYYFFVVRIISIYFLIILDDLLSDDSDKLGLLLDVCNSVANIKNGMKMVLGAVQKLRSQGVNNLHRVEGWGVTHFFEN